MNPLQQQVSPLRYVDIENEYRNWITANPNGDPVDLGTFAREMDAREGVQKRTQAYNPNFVKSGSAAVDRALTPVSDVTGWIGEMVGTGADRVLGTDGRITPVFQEIGRELPRDLIEGVPFMVATGGAGALSKAAKVGRYASMLDAAVRGYTETDNPLVGAVYGAAMPAADQLVERAGRLATRAANPVLNKLETATAKDLATLEAPGARLRTNAAAIAGEAAGGVAANELTRQAVLTAQGVPLLDESRNPFTVENVAAMGAGGVLQAVPTGVRTFVERNKPYNVRATDVLMEWANENLQARGLVVEPGQDPIDAAVRASGRPSIPNDWAVELMSSNLRDISRETRPEVRTAMTNELVNKYMASRGFNPNASLAEKAAVRAMSQGGDVSPEEFVQLTALANDLFERAVRQIDTANAERDPFFESEHEGTLTSGAAIQQYIRDGFLERPDAKWIKKSLDEETIRSLTNHDGDAWRVTTQKVVNQLLMHAEVAKSERAAVNTRLSIESTPTAVKDFALREKLAPLFGALTEPEGSDLGKLLDRPSGQKKYLDDTKTKEGDLTIREAILRRFIELDQNDTGSKFFRAPAFAEEAGYMLQALAKNPNVAVKGLLDTVVVLPSRKRVPNPEFGKKDKDGITDQRETIVVPGEAENTLRDLITGKRSVYKASRIGAKSQKEIAMSDVVEGGDVDSPTYEVIFDDEGEVIDRPELEQDQVSENPDDETVEAPTPEDQLLQKHAKTHFDGIPESDAERMLGVIQPKLDAAKPEDLWPAIRHAFAPPGKNVYPNVEANKKDKAVLLVKALLEAGPTVAKGDEGQGQVGEAGRAFMQAVNHKPLPGGEFRNLRMAVRDFLRVSGKTTDQVTEEIVRATAKWAGVEPPTARSGGGEGDDPRPRPDFSETTGTTKFDVGRLFKGFYMRLGYTPDVATHFSKLGLTILQRMKDVQVVVSKLDDNAYVQSAGDATKAMGRVFEELSTLGTFGMVQYADKGPRSVLMLAMNHTAGNSPRGLVAYEMLATLVHELIHGIEERVGMHDIASRELDGLMRQRAQAWAAIQDAAHWYKPAQKYLILETVARATIPEEMMFNPDGSINKILAGSLAYGSQAQTALGAYEFVNVLGQMIGVGLLTGGNNMKVNSSTVFNHMPEEVQMFAKGFYRDITDHVGALHEALTNEELNPYFNRSTDVFRSQIRGRIGDWEYISRDLARLIERSREMLVGIDPASAVAQAEQIVTALETGLGGIKSPPVIVRPSNEVKDLAKLFGVEAPESIHMTFSKAQQTLMGFVPQASYQKVGPVDPIDVGWWFKRLTPMYQTLQRFRRMGLPLADSVQNSLMDLHPKMARVSSALLSPFLTTDAHGRRVFDPDNLALRAAKDPQVRTAVNKMLEWQQRKQTMMVEQVNGQWQPNVAGKPEFDQIMSALPVEKRQMALSGLVKMMEVYQIGAGVLIDSQRSTVTWRVAKLIMGRSKGLPYDQAQLMAGGVVTSLMNNDLPGAQAAMATLHPDTQNAVMSIMNDGLLASIRNLQARLAGRPWFASETRPGRYLIKAKNTQSGEITWDGADSREHASARSKQIEAKGFQVMQVLDKYDINQLANFDAPEQILERYTEIEERAFERYLNTNPSGLSQDVIDSLRATYQPGAEVGKQLTLRGVSKFMATRKEVPAALGHDYFDSMRQYVASMAGATAKRAVRQEVDMILSDPRAKNQEDFQLLVKEQLDALMTPASQEFQTLKAMTSAYYLGLNFSSMIVEGTQAAQTLVPVILSRGTQSIADAYKLVGQSVKDLVWVMRPSNQAQIDRLAASAEAKFRLGNTKLTPEETKAVWYRRAVRDGILDFGAIHDYNYGRDQELLLASKFGRGDRADKTLTGMFRDGAYLVAQKMMWFYGHMSNMNQKLAFLTGLNQAQALGKTGLDAYNHARHTKDLSMFGGGKANQPGYLAAWSNENTRSTLGLVHTLQQYGMGLVGLYAELASQSIASDKKLSPGQKMQARKALGVMTATQVVFAGAMGLPFAGAALAVVEKVFGVNAQAALREALASLVGADDEDASEFQKMLTEMAMSGAASQLLGVDLSSRMGVNNFLGTSAYSGFSFKDMLGPTPSIVENFINALNYASTGQPGKAASALVPQAFKNVVELARSKLTYGDYGFRDLSNNLLYQPSNMEAAAYAIGFRPSDLVRKRSAQRLIKQSDENYNRRRDQQMDGLAREMLNGQTENLYAWIQDEIRKNPTNNPQAQMQQLVHAISERAVNMTNEYDLLARGPVGNAEARQRIGSTFAPSVLPRQSEVDRRTQRLGLEAQVGLLPADPGAELAQAAVVDQLVASGMSRSLALRMVSMMGL